MNEKITNKLGIANCLTYISRGDHEIISEVELHRINSEHYNFAYVRFRRGNRYFTIAGTSDTGVYLDDRHSLKRTWLYDAWNDRLQSITATLTLSFNAEEKTGNVVLTCHPLSDRYGRSKQLLKYTIAEWDANGVMCKMHLPEDKKQFPLKAKGNVQLYLNLTKVDGSATYNSAEVYFTTLETDNTRPLIREYKFLHQVEADTIFLFPQHCKELLDHDDRLFVVKEEQSDRGYIPLLQVKKMILTLPTAGSLGTILMRGRLLDQENGEFEEVIASFDPFGNVESL
ncbi:hypothetical protein [Lysinibacillus fusiformis]|uniref:hypothetical protein n=1 Tax=Lysinibacillus fusiformis TaxID=28031 RepID=UPI0023A92C93|nr:hypothetical protein [Lysinibacillus fusiformis]WEA41656.1 hypothetical protein PWJ66_23240 [Lysinibacillus fusiformis]